MTNDPNFQAAGARPGDLAARLQHETEKNEMPDTRMDGLPKPDQHSELPRVSTVLFELVNKWRNEAAESLVRWPRGAILPAQKLRMCADELEAAITKLETADAPEHVCPYEPICPI